VNDIFSEDRVQSREEGLFPGPQSRLNLWGCSTFVGERLGGKVGTNVIRVSKAIRHWELLARH